MIRFTSTSFRYEAEKPWVLDGVDLVIEEGEFVVVVGPTGVGKSTFLKTLNGLVPTFSGGEYAGEVVVGGRSLSSNRPADMADLVGYVGQNPSASFVTERVEDELAYAMENLGLDPVTMRRRVEDALDVMSLHEIRESPLGELSGGQRQRVAIAAVLAAAPKILVLDEPTSALDPGAAEEVLSALTRLVHDVGLTVIVAEHRLERVLPFADQVIVLEHNGVIHVGPPASMMAHSPIAPPLVELGNLLGWAPLAMSVREARRRVGDVKALLEDCELPTVRPIPEGSALTTSNLTLNYGEQRALKRVTLDFAPGTLYALLGRNGSGKTTLLNVMAGLLRPSHGTALLHGQPPFRMAPSDRIDLVGLVPQDPGDLLYAQEVGEECRTADREHHLEEGSTLEMVQKILGKIELTRHPNDLSEGQRLSLALAVVMAAKPKVLLLDEPTRGLDYCAKLSLIEQLHLLRSEGVCVVVATHDVEFVAQSADQAIVLSQGEVIAQGSAREVICHTPVFAPQVAKVFSPLDWLTVKEVMTALGGKR